MDDWSISAKINASGEASNIAKSVSLTQARFFMDDQNLTTVQPNQEAQVESN